MGIKLSRWDAIEHLWAEAGSTRYLNACREEDPGDGSLIRAALADIARTRGMAQVARAAGNSLEGLRKALSHGGHPAFSTVVKVVNELGLRLQVVRA